MVEIANIRIGRTMDGRSMNFPLYREGAASITAMTQTGKSCIAMLIGNEASRQRPIWIFSYNDEYNNMIYPNAWSLNPSAIDINKTDIFRGIKVRISDYDSKDDWQYLTGIQGGASFCYQLSQQIHMHHDIPEAFCEQVSLTETNPKKTQAHTIHPSTLTSLMNKQQEITNFFSSSNPDLEHHDYVSSAAKRRNMIFDLGLSKGNKLHAQVYIGHVLRKLREVVGIVKPLIIFEEADILLESDSYSCEQIIHYHLKKVKEGIFMLFIAQEEYRMPRDINDNIKVKMYGKMHMREGDTYLNHLINSIKWEHAKGYREFVYHDIGRNFITKFIPADVPCFINRR